MANDDTDVSLQEAERLREAVARQSARWYSRYFTFLGLALFGAFCVYALPWPWMWAVFAVVLVGLLTFFWFYERGQQVRRRASQRRFWIAFACYLGLVLGLTVADSVLFEGTPTWWYFVSACVVAVPFFIAAALERRSVVAEARDGESAA